MDAQLPEIRLPRSGRIVQIAPRDNQFGYRVVRERDLLGWPDDGRRPLSQEPHFHDTWPQSYEVEAGHVRWSVVVASADEPPEETAHYAVVADGRPRYDRPIEMPEVVWGTTAVHLLPGGAWVLEVPGDAQWIRLTFNGREREWYRVIHRRGHSDAQGAGWVRLTTPDR